MRARCVTGGLPRTGRRPDRRNVPDTGRFGSVIRLHDWPPDDWQLPSSQSRRSRRRGNRPCEDAAASARTRRALRGAASGPDEQPVADVPVPGPAGDGPGVRHAVVDDGGGQAADLDGAPDGCAPARAGPVAPGGIGRRGARPSGSPAPRRRGARARRSRRETAPRPPKASPPAAALRPAAPAARRSTPRRAPIRWCRGSPRDLPARHPCRRAPAAPAARRPCGPARRRPARGAAPRGAPLPTGGRRGRRPARRPAGRGAAGARARRRGRRRCRRRRAGEPARPAAGRRRRARAARAR